MRIRNLPGWSDFKYLAHSNYVLQQTFKMKSYRVTGLMSGTSLDGLDIAYCEFREEQHWKYQILHAITIPYPDDWRTRMLNLGSLSGMELVRFHTGFGKYCGMRVAEFLKERNLKTDFIASHGHTVFHQPAAGYTFQAGDGAALCAAAGLSVVCDFRSMDVALGGQGAPLVPVGDQLLFGEYEYCLNLGGISNVSFDRNGLRLASDISVCNILLNELAGLRGKLFDEDGKMARTGKCSDEMLKELNALPYYFLPFPKSLGREDLESTIIAVFRQNRFNLSPEDLMATAVEHVAQQIGPYLSGGKSLLTGGGALNHFLTERIAHYSTSQIIIPDDLMVNYKEALIFAFLGLKRWRQELNCLKTVTGASRDCIGGAVYLAEPLGRQV